MKKTIFLSSVLALGLASVVFASALAAAFKWVETEHRFGQIQQGKPVTAIFKFTNSGAEPLLISSARGSCGCTGVEYPKEPISPGASGEIKATFNAVAVGLFTKSVMVESNVESGTTTLQIQGEVVQ